MEMKRPQGYLSAFNPNILVADLKHTELLDEHKERGTLFYHGRDKDGKRMLIFRVRTHTKSKDQMEDMKKFVLYQVERLERYLAVGEQSGDLIAHRLLTLIAGRRTAIP